MLITSNRAGFRIIDCYFESFPASGACRADIVRCHQLQRPIPGAHCTPFGTLILDLGRTADDIFSGMKADTRRMIRKAERDGVTWEAADAGNPTVRNELANFFNRCRVLKGLPPVSRALLRRLAVHQALALTTATNADGQLMAANSYIVTSSRARSLYTAAIFREAETSQRKALIARAGRLMWWNDILHFQQRSGLLFDFGGFYLGRSDPEKLRINAYKAEFGGELREEFNCEQGMTLRGRLALWAVSRIRRWQEHNRSNQSIPAEVFN